MMMVDRKQIELAAHIDLTRCYAKSNQVIEERKRWQGMVAKARVRAGDDSPWLVLKVMTGRELAVGDALIADSVEALVPMKMGKKLRRRHQEIEPKKEPVFIGYIFVRCIISNEALAGLLGFTGVIGVLGGYDNPYLVEDKKVLSFNEKADKGHFDHEVPQQVFRRGMKVLIRDGIFAGSKGEIISGGADGKGNAVVSIHFLGGITPAIMPLAILHPL